MDLERRANENLLTVARQLHEVASMFNPENFDVEEARRVFEVSSTGITFPPVIIGEHTTLTFCVMATFVCERG
jgi:hypothetical protein